MIKTDIKELNVESQAALELPKKIKTDIKELNVESQNSIFRPFTKFIY